MIAQTLAVYQPHLVDKLVLGCTHFGGHSVAPPNDDFLRAFSFDDYKRMGAFDYTARLLALNYTPAWCRDNQEVFNGIVTATLSHRRPFGVIVKQMAGPFRRGAMCAGAVLRVVRSRAFDRSHR